MIKAIVYRMDAMQEMIYSCIVFSCQDKPFASEEAAIKDLAQNIFKLFKQNTTETSFSECCLRSKEKNSEAHYCCMCGSKLDFAVIDFFYFSEWFSDLLSANIELHHHLQTAEQKRWKILNFIDILPQCGKGEILFLNDKPDTDLLLAMEDCLNPEEKKCWDFWHEEQRGTYYPLDMLQGI